MWQPGPERRAKKGKYCGENVAWGNKIDAVLAKKGFLHPKIYSANMCISE